jgi:hypothetical protein
VSLTRAVSLDPATLPTWIPSRGTLLELVAADDPKSGRFSSAATTAAQPPHRQVPEGAGVEEGVVELASLSCVHVAQRRVADDLLDATAQFRARRG